MHQLTIDHNAKSVTISDHPDFTDAHRALMIYVIGADYYLRQLPSADPHTSYELVQLADADDPATFASPASPGAPSSRSSPARRCPCHRPTTTPATCSAGSTTTNARGDMDPKATPATATP